MHFFLHDSPPNIKPISSIDYKCSQIYCFHTAQLWELTCFLLFNFVAFSGKKKKGLQRNPEKLRRKYSDLRNLQGIQEWEKSSADICEIVPLTLADFVSALKPLQRLHKCKPHDQNKTVDKVTSIVNMICIIFCWRKLELICCLLHCWHIIL